MDHSSSRIVLVLVLWFKCLACNCEAVSSESYLDFPTDFSTDFHKNIAAALKKIVVEDPYAPMQWFATAIEKAQKETETETDKQVYSDLIELRKGNFKGRLETTFLSICAQAANDPNSGLKPWKDYLVQIGRDRFRSTLRIYFDANDYIKREDIGTTLEMNQVFAAAFNMKGDLRVREIDLAQEMSSLDLAKDKSFKAKYMISAIRRITRDNSTEDPFRLLKNYMLERCERLMANEDLKVIISRMDLLRYLNHKIPTEPFEHAPLRLLDEYHRLCLSLERPDTSSFIRDNLNERLKNKWHPF